MGSESGKAKAPSFSLNGEGSKGGLGFRGLGFRELRTSAAAETRVETSTLLLGLMLHVTLGA